jgi:D-alanyl-D-alanine carboxypeptidase
MKTIITAIALISFTSLIVAQETIVTNNKQQQIIEYISYMEQSNQLMGSVSISENGTEIINITFGEKNTSEEHAADTKYTIGSITKLFTAVLLAKLYEEGKISLEESLSNYYPEIPNSEKITIRNMLNHTSGLMDYVIKNDSLYFWLLEPVSQKDVIDEIIRQDIEFQPGERMRYSNSSYYLLARILEKKYNKPYKQILSDVLTTPLGLKNTFGVDEKSHHQNIAKSYGKKDGEWVEMGEFYFPNVSGVGDIISTTSDLNTFLHALFSNQIITRSTIDLMLPEANDMFGMGIMKIPFYEHTGYGHGGDTYGTHSVATYNSDNNLSISYIINGENYPTNDFAICLLSIIYSKDFDLPEFKEYKPELRYFEMYGGIYGAPDFPINLKIYEEDNQLLAQGEGQPAFSLTPVEKHLFEYKKAGIKLAFEPFENMVTLEQAGQKFELKKL